jgi:hypothetical protein
MLYHHVTLAGNVINKEMGETGNIEEQPKRVFWVWVIVQLLLLTWGKQ